MVHPVASMSALVAYVRVRLPELSNQFFDLKVPCKLFTRAFFFAYRKE